MHSAHIPAFAAEHIAGLPHETPYFLISEAALLRNVAVFRAALPDVAVHYALKANSEPRVLRILAEAGCGFEAASCYELRLLQDIGVEPHRVIYGTSVKPVAHIKEFVRAGADRFACDSLSELEKIAAIAPHARVYMRLAVNDAGSVFKFSEKFGTDPSSAVSLMLRAKEFGLRPYGLSFHVGSQARNPHAWGAALRIVSETMDALVPQDIRIECINMGGGFPCQYASSEQIPVLEEIAPDILTQYGKLPYAPRLLIEPGRGLVADAAVLVASVIGRVRRGDTDWLFLDAGVYNGLFEAMAYQGSTRYPVESVRLSNRSGESLFALAGPTGDAPDVVMREALLPSDMDVGDRLIFHHAGAYTLSVTSAFNGFPKPDCYII